MNSEDKINKADFLLDMLKRYDHYIGTVNVKANLLLAFLGVVMFGVILRLVAFDFSAVNCWGSLLLVVALGTLLVCLYAIWLLMEIVLPDMSTDSHSKSLIFYADVARHNKAADYISAFTEADNHTLMNDLGTQVYYVAKVTKNKFDKLIKASKIIKNIVLPSLSTLIILFILGGQY